MMRQRVQHTAQSTAGGRPPARCPACGRPTRDPAERFYAYLLRVFSADPVAHGVVVDAFKALERAEAEGGPGCPNHLDAFLAMCREVVATYGAA
ncbi:MAG TPA: hypothetical protein VFE48_25500 [Methylomirabilota bacterium]|nr:hypothetical protein [Methylomirabilota bacterium]